MASIQTNSSNSSSIKQAVFAQEKPAKIDELILTLTKERVSIRRDKMRRNMSVMMHKIGKLCDRQLDSFMTSLYTGALNGCGGTSVVAELVDGPRNV